MPGPVFQEVSPAGLGIVRLSRRNGNSAKILSKWLLKVADGVPATCGGIEVLSRGNGIARPSPNEHRPPSRGAPRSPPSTLWAASTLSVSLILYLWDEFGVADLGRPDFEILGGFVIVACQRTERHFQIVLPRHVGQVPDMVCSVAIVGDVDHTCETAWVRLPFLLSGLRE